MAEVITDWERAEFVFGALLEALEREQYPYNVSKPPQRRENLPEELVWGSREHAWFLFCVCYYMRGGIESETAILAMGRLYKEYPVIFDPEYSMGSAGDHEREWVQDLLERYSLNYNAEETSRSWVANFRKLHRFWRGSPAALLEGTESYEEICRRIIHRSRKSSDNPHGFYGFREKMVSMLIYFLMDAEIIRPFLFPVPVDFHVLRLMVANRLLEVKGAKIGDDYYLPEVQAAARELSAGYCQKHGVNPLRLGDALWLFSNTACPTHPGNQTRIGKRNGRKTDLTPVFVCWNEAQVRRYQRSCARCPIKKTCDYNVPAGDYYVRGKLIIRGNRDRPLLLFE